MKLVIPTVRRSFIAYHHRKWVRRLTFLLLAWMAYGGAARADVVTFWTGVATDAIATALPAERPSVVQWAMVHVAMYDAVNAIDGRYEVFLASPTTMPAGASLEAAAGAAAYVVLSNSFPSQQAMLNAAYASSLAAIADGDAKNRGIAVGTEVANAVIADRADDGRFANVPYVVGSGPGVYQLTPPAYGAPGTPGVPLTPWMARVRPFVMSSPSQFRGDGPPALASAEYVADFNEVKARGAVNSSVRSVAETEIARFYTDNPNRFWGRNMKNFIEAQGLGVTDSARLAAMIFVSLTDSQIACWDAKYAFNFWRPVTAIPAADIDGNAATTADAAWSPLVVTPPHPEYPSGHGCVSAAVMESLRQFFGTKNITLVFNSSVTGTTHTFQHTEHYLNEVSEARILGGMHFRAAVEDGTAIGKKVGKWVGNHQFQPVAKPGNGRN